MVDENEPGNTRPSSTPSTQQQREMLELLAEVSRSGMPLPEGLRAAAEETQSSRLSAHLRLLATQFESGMKLGESSMGQSASGLPPHVMGVVRAGVRSGNLGEALDSLIDQDRAYRDIWRHLVSSLAYPTMLLIATLLLFVAAVLLIVEPSKAMLDDFGMELSGNTKMWIELATGLPAALAVGGIMITALLIGLRCIGGRVTWARFLSGIPVLGTLFHLAGVSQMLRLMEVMLSHDMPLPEAMRLTSSGVANPNMQVVASWLAQGTAAGVPLSDLIEASPRLPASIVPVVRWGERNDAMSDSLRSAYELLEGRIRLQGSLLSVLVGPLMLIFIAVLLGSLLVAMFLPLVSLIQNLT